MVPVWFATEVAQAMSPGWTPQVEQPSLTSLSSCCYCPTVIVPSQSAACVHCLVPRWEFVQICSWAAVKQVNFSSNWLPGRWKEIKLLLLNVSWQSYCFCCVVRETASIMAHSRTVSHMLAWINAAQISENWILPRKLQPSPAQPTDAEGPLNSMAVYIWLVWSCSCRHRKYHPTVHELFASPPATVWLFPSLCSCIPRFDVFSPIASLWSLLAWVMGELRAGKAWSCPATGSQAWAWPEESRHGLQWDISCLCSCWFS